MRIASRSRRTALSLFAAGILVASIVRADSFKMYQLRVYCGDSQVATVIFGHIVDEPTMGTKVMCAGNCPGGKVPIADALAGLPADVSAAFEAKVKKHEENAAAGNGQSLAGCDCDNERIDRLKGRIRGLKEAAVAHRKDFNQKTKDRADARDRLWGKGEGIKFEGGSIAEFGKSVRDSLMVAGGGSGVGKIVKKAENVQDWIETGSAIVSDPTSLDAWSEYGEKVLGEKADEVIKQRTTEALRAAREHFARTGNYAGAQNVYKQKWGSYGDLKKFQEAGEKVTKFLDALTALAELAKNTDTVTTDLSDWVSARKDGDNLQKELDKIDDEIQRVTDEIARLRAACEKGSGSSHRLQYALLGGAGMTRTDIPSSPFVRTATAKPAAAQGDIALKRAEQALRGLADLKRKIQIVDRRLGADIVGPFSPWFGGVWKEAQPRALLFYIAKDARVSLKKFRSQVTAMTPIAAEAKASLESIPPDTGI